MWSADDFRKRLYQLIAIEDESQRESAMEDIVNEYATYGTQYDEMTAELDSLKETLTKTESDRDIYRERWAKLVANDTLEPDKKDDEEVVDYERKVFKED